LLYLTYKKNFYILAFLFIIHLILSRSFDISFKKRFSWGEIEICLKCKEGYIVDSKVYSDAMDYEVITEISKKINGIRFEMECIINSIRELNQDGIKSPIIEEVTDWLNENT